jgi:ribose 5-phosphate isomerase A
MPEPLPNRDAQKRAAAEAAVSQVQDGMRVGIGTGSTAAFAIEALGRRIAEGLRIEGLATSLATEEAARIAAIPLIDLGAIDGIDLCIDGVDEIDPAFRAIKGAGGAMLREKIVASAAGRMIAIADLSKRVDQLGRAPVPVEVLPMATALVAKAIGHLGGSSLVRRNQKGALVLTDQGNPIIDTAFGPISDPEALASSLSAIPGALGHGLFVSEIDELYLGTESGVLKFARK